MRPFLQRTFVAAVLCALVALVLDQALRWRSAGHQYERYADLNVIRAGRSKADVLVLGNSRARYHYDTRVIGARLGRSCYNLGMIGHPILDQLGKLRYHLEHNPPPSLVIVNMDIDSWRRLERDTISQYEQFLDDIRDPVVLGLVRHKVGFKRPDVLPWARFAGFPGYVWKIAAGDTVTNVFNGFVSDTTVMPAAALKKVLPPYVHDGPRFAAYLSAIRAHRRHCWPQARIVYVESPTFEHDRVEVLPHLLPLIDARYESALPIDLSWVHDTTLFMNRTHLNHRGAAVFSRLVADSLLARGL